MDGEQLRVGRGKHQPRPHRGILQRRHRALPPPVGLTEHRHGLPAVAIEPPVRAAGAVVGAEQARGHGGGAGEGTLLQAHEGVMRRARVGLDDGVVGEGGGDVVAGEVAARKGRGAAAAHAHRVVAVKVRERAPCTPLHVYNPVLHTPGGCFSYNIQQITLTNIEYVQSRVPSCRAPHCNSPSSAPDPAQPQRTATALPKNQE